jgi:ABC-type uncharacterized transport system permease subunit
MGFPGSRNLSRHPGTDNPEIIAGTGMHWGVLAAFIAVIAAYVLMNRHMLGYQIRLAGRRPRAARFAGVNPNRLVLLCLGISGALAGLAGCSRSPAPPARSASISTWATGSPRSSWPSSGGCTPSASCSRGC